jgi:hypothetical protein
MYNDLRFSGLRVSNSEQLLEDGQVGPKHVAANVIST